MALITCLLLGFTGAVILTQPPTAFKALEWLFPRIVWQVETREPLVALTFDDGPAAHHTPQVLETLARHGAHATFFLIGERAAAHPDIVRKIREGGHEVGNHYLVDHSTLRVSDAEFASNLHRTEEILGLEGSLKLFRPPGGLIRSSHLTYARSQGYTCVLGSVHPYDPVHPPATYMRWQVTRNLAPGVIVILHDGIADPSRTLSALDHILDAGRQRNLRFVTVGALFAAAADVPARVEPAEPSSAPGARGREPPAS
jgi:peptidoglycan/xylan/chitin deacetylase (PgdA/CDA1 family)